MSSVDWSKAPDDATHYAPAHHSFVALWAKIDASGRFVYQPLNRSREWYHGAQPSGDEQYIQRPTESWSGVGLPTVGTVCEYQRNDVTYRQAWVAVTPLYLGESITVMRHQASGCEFYEMTDSCVFRPIRTPEQIAADEREAAIKEIEDLIAGYSYRHCAEMIHKAGYRKQPTKQDGE